MSKARGLADLGNVYDDGALSNRNILINGAMQVWQRGTSGTVNYVTDRFATYNTTSVSKVSSSLAGFGSAMRIVTTASDPQLQQQIENTEGYLAGQTMTLSFWMKSDIAEPFDTGQYCEYYDGSGTYQILAVDVPSVIETNGAWKRYSRTFTLPTTATGFKFNARIDFNETTIQTLDITGVQLEVGDTASPFEHPRSYGDELQRCQRYYQVGKFSSYSAGATGMAIVHSYIHEMRSAPTVTRTAYAASSSETGTAISGANTHSFYAFNASTHVGGWYTLDAEL